MNRETKVKKVTEKNYSEVCKRASDLKNRIRTSLKRGAFPSIHFMVQKWGFQLSDAALERHRKNVLKELGIRKTPKATLFIERRKRAVAMA